MKRLGLGLLVAVLAFSQESAAWQKSMVGGLNMTQTSFDNWSSGGENAFAWQLNLSYKFVREHARGQWSNSGKFAYGANKNGDADARKSVDEIKIESKYVYKLESRLNPYAAFNMETQFTQGYNYATEPETPISAFLDPGYFRESFGAGFDIRSGLSTRLGLSMKQTVSSEYAALYSDDPETDALEKNRNEFGFESVSELSLSVSETSTLDSKLELFSALKALDETDVNWDNTLTVKISEYMNVNVNLKLVYDKDISIKRQLKQAMALGLNYTFI